MARVKRKRDFKKTKAGGSFSPIPKCECKVIIVGTEYVQNASKTGKLLKVSMKVDSGKHKGRLLWDNLNLENESEQAENIAWEDFKSLCLAADMANFPQDTEDLHRKVIRVKVGIEPASKQYKAKNVIDDYLLPKKDKNGEKGKKKGKKKPSWAK